MLRIMQDESGEAPDFHAEHPVAVSAPMWPVLAMPVAGHASRAAT